MALGNEAWQDTVAGPETKLTYVKRVLTEGEWQEPAMAGTMPSCCCRVFLNTNADSMHSTITWLLAGHTFGDAILTVAGTHPSLSATLQKMLVSDSCPSKLICFILMQPHRSVRSC